MSDQVSFITKNINDILNTKKTWRGSTDIFKAFDENNNVKYLLKEVNFPKKYEDQQKENTIFQDIIRSEDFKKYLLTSEGSVSHNERQFIVFLKEGKSLRKWLKQQQSLDWRRLYKIVLQFIDIQDLFNRQCSGNFYLADQFAAAFSILENDQLRLIPIRISNQEFKDHVFCKYIQTLAEEEILFPYPPAILEEALTFEIKSTIIERGEKLDMYAIGTFLLLIREMIDEKDLFGGEEDLKNPQVQNENTSILLNDLLLRMLETHPVMPLSMNELKEQLMKISKDGQTEIEISQSTNTIQEVKSQVIKNKQTYQNIISNSNKFLDKTIVDDLIEQEKFEPNGKWSLCVLQLLSIKEEKLSKSDKYLLFLSIKKWLDRVMNHFYFQIEVEKKDCLQSGTPEAQQQKLSILKELGVNYKRALTNPTELGLIDFFLSAKQQAQQSSKDSELCVSLTLSRNQILKALVSSKNWQKAILFSEHILTRETKNIEAMLISAQCCLKLKSNEALKFVDLVLQEEPKNSSAIYFKAKFYQSIKCDSIQAIQYFKKCLTQESEKDITEILDVNISYYPTKSRVHYELGKLHWKLNNSEKYMENFKACLSFLEKSKDSNNKHNKMKINSLKILLLGYLNEMNNKEIQNIKLAQISFVSSSRDPDLCALLSESVLVSRFHPQLAMHFVEQGLQARLFNEDEKLDENSKIQVIPQNFGCLIQQAKINFKIGRNPQNIIDFLLTLKQTIENNSKKQSQLEEEIKDTFKGQPKKGFQVDIDWAYFLNMLLVEMNIEIGNLNKAQDYILPSTKAEKYFKKRIQCEEAHWKAKILLNNGNRQSALELLEENFSYGPSCYLFGIEHFKEIQFQKAEIGLLKATEMCPNDIQYLEALANLYWEQISIIDAQKFFFSYMAEIQKENRILKQLQKRRLRFPQRKIPFDNISITRLGRCLFIQGNDRLAQRMLRFSLKIKNSESLTLLWHSEIFFQKKKYAQVKKLLEQIPEIDQNNEDYYFFLGVSYIQTENYAIGKEILNKIQQSLSQYKNYYSLIKSLGKASLKELELEEAQKYFEQCIQIQDQDSEVFSSLGQCYLAKKDYQNTKIYFLKSLEVTNENKSLFTSLINIFQILQEAPDVDVITNLEPNFIQNKTMLNLLGQIYFEAGPKDPKFYTPSEKYFKLSNKLSANSKQPDLYLLQISFLRLAQLAYLQREYAESVKLMQEFLSTMVSANQTDEQILQRKGVEYEAYFFLTQLYSYLGENQLERKFIFKCIKMKPENGHLYLKFGFYLLSQQSQAAWKFFEKGMSLLKDEDQEQEDILILKSLQAIQNNQTEDAMKLLTKCAMLHVSSEKCLKFLGQQYYQQKQYKEATQFYQNCINMSSTGVQQLGSLILSEEEKINCFISLGKAHIKANKLFEASNVMKRCLKLFPQNSKVLAYLSQFQFKEGSTHDANQSASSSILAGQCDPKIYEILAVTSMRIGNTFQAIQALEECIKLQPNFKKVQLQLGHIYYSIARPKEALQYYLQYLSCYPKSSQGLVRSSKLLVYYKSFSLAQSHLDGLFVLIKENNKNHPQTHLDQSIEIKHSFSKESVLENEYFLEDEYVRLEDAYSVQGYLWLQQNNLSEALLSYEKAHQKNPKSQAIQFSLAFVCSQLGNFKQEIKIYKEMLKQEQSPKNQLNIQLNLGLAYKKAGKIQKSIQTYEKANIDLSNQCSKNLLANLGAFLIESKEYSKAIGFLIQVLENDRNHTESLFLLGIANQNQGLFLDASKFFERSIKSNVWYSPSYLQLSSLKCNLGKLSEAISVCQSALENCHSKERILLFLGNIYFKSNDFWTALVTFQQILTIDCQKKEKNQFKPNEITILCNLQIARVYRKLNEDEKAIDHLRNSCLNNSPDQPEYLHELGSILIHHKSRQIESLEMLKRAVNARPDNAIYTFSLANALHHLHYYELEIDSLKKCLEFKSNFKLKIYNNLAIAYQLTHNSTKHLDTLMKAIQKFPDVASLYFNLGNCYQSSRMLVQAVEQYQICISKDPTHFEAFHNLAVVSVQLKDFQSAANYFSRCFFLHPEKNQIYYPKIVFLMQKGYFANEI